MSECKYKAKDGECLYEKRFPYKEYCVEGPCPHDTPMTNADRIRSMTDEELALWLAKFTDCGECPINAYPHCTTSEESCACSWHEWLKEEVSE